VEISLNQDIFTLLNFVTMPHDITINEKIKINQESTFDSTNKDSAINRFWNTSNYYLANLAL